MYLVTGGAGFIGSHLATALVERGAAVRVFDNFSGGSRANLAHLGDRVEIVEGDLRDEAAVRRAARGAAVIFHQAAEPSVPKSIADPRTTYDVNVGGTLNLLLAAREAGTRRVVLASTCAVYGDATELPLSERVPPAPRSPYASSKLAGEGLGQVFGRAYGLEAVALRYFNVFGPRQDPNSAYAAVIPRFVAALRAGRAPTIYGDGEQSRDFVYVGDVVAANLLAADVPGIGGRVVNVAAGRAATLNELLATLRTLVGAPVAAVHAPPRAGDIRHSLADIALARTMLGYEPRVSLEEGLARTVAAMADEPAAVA